ncbi:hypothetical protein DV736_g3279, partial [Chaetothyriales sp. CBS 134916]
MPLNTLRLNYRPSTHPNDRIVFIKPLPRPANHQHEYHLADTFLRAIAAQCLPIMKTHWLSVTTLEEFEPNSEFMGRNFNAGECIQLVLQRKNTTKDRNEREADDVAAPMWLPFEVVQMVMMHELAHNLHMNHAKPFWETRNLFATELKALWARGYTGDGFWSGGQALGDLTTLIHGDGGGSGVVRSDELAELPLCGATISCPVCSLNNPSTVSTCSACAHVLDINKDPRRWACPSAACQDMAYINGGDAGLCGLCGERKPPPPPPPSP